MTLPKAEAERLLSRIQFHHTPKHASWLNMAEIELNSLGKQCINRRIPTEGILVREIAAWQNSRNKEGVKINWRFTVKDARKKFKYTRPELS